MTGHETVLVELPPSEFWQVHVALFVLPVQVPLPSHPQLTPEQLLGDAEQVALPDPAIIILISSRLKMPLIFFKLNFVLIVLNSKWGNSLYW